MRNMLFHYIIIIILTASTCLSPGPLSAAVPRDIAAVESFIDSIIRDSMKKMHIPGVTISMVRGKHVIFKKGYGYADLEKKIPVDPDKSLLAAASVTKLFTATAVMQLAEKGKLSLNRDINDYLTEFSIGTQYPEPVTAAHLLTHTSGFDVRIINIAAFSRSEIQPMQDYLASGSQKRIMPPGKWLSYSNYGYTMLGYLVERISGMDYDEYVTKNILIPLNMKKSMFTVPDNLSQDMASSYTYAGGEYTKHPPVYLNVKPAGSLKTTAADMSHFMTAHLNSGIYRGNSILKEETVRLMHRRHFTQHPELPGWAYGFYERSINGLRIIEHAGDLSGYRSLMALVPDKNFGFFISANGGDEQYFKFREILLQKIMDRFFPAAEKTGTPGTALKADDSYTGYYRLNTYSRLAFDKIIALFMTAKITAGTGGRITLHYPVFLSEKPLELTMIKPRLFINTEGTRHVAFSSGQDGDITHMNLHYMMPMNFEKVPWYGGTAFNFTVIIFFMTMFLSAFPGWALWAGIKRIRKKTDQDPPKAHRSRIVAGLTCYLNLSFIGGLAAARSLGTILSKAQLDMILALLFTLPFMSIAGTVISLYVTALCWKRKFWTLPARIHFSAVTAALTAFTWFIFYWNLLGYKF